MAEFTKSQRRRYKEILIAHFLGEVDDWPLDGLIDYCKSMMEEKLKKAKLEDLIRDYENYSDCHISELIEEIPYEED